LVDGGAGGEIRAHKPGLVFAAGLGLFGAPLLGVGGKEEREQRKDPQGKDDGFHNSNGFECWATGMKRLFRAELPRQTSSWWLTRESEVSGGGGILPEGKLHVGDFQADQDFKSSTTFDPI
jgi:hypothetical protein